MSTALQTPDIVNGIDTVALKQLIADIDTRRKSSMVKFNVATHWRGGTQSETRVDDYVFDRQRIERDFSIHVDEPLELGGQNTQPNPQEMLMAAFNSCMLVGYVAGATLHGIELESLVIETDGELDLRGFLGLDAKVKPGYDVLHYIVRIKGNGTPEQFAAIHETVMKTSPNRFNIASPIKLTSDLIVE